MAVSAAARRCACFISGFFSINKTGQMMFISSTMVHLFMERNGAVWRLSASECEGVCIVHVTKCL